MRGLNCIVTETFTASMSVESTNESVVLDILPNTRQLHLDGNADLIKHIAAANPG